MLRGAIGKSLGATVVSGLMSLGAHLVCRFYQPPLAQALPLLRREKRSLCLAPSRKNVHLALEVLYTLGITRESRERFELSVASRAMPEVPNMLTIKILSVHRGNQCVVAPGAINSEEGAWIERHRFHRPLLPVSSKLYSREAKDL